jgi:hypothetical protein
MAEGRGEGQVAIVEYREEDGVETPYLLLVKEALIEEVSNCYLVMVIFGVKCRFYWVKVIKIFCGK